MDLNGFEGLDLFLIEGCLVLAAIVLALTAPKLGEGVFRRIEQAFLSIARRPVLSLMVMLIAPLAIRALLLQIRPLPAPYIHDEFSYLLQGDTLAHGRLTNTPHPLWQFFESIHILQQPTYAGMYQPGHPLFLAIGQLLTGYPWFGVALETGVMCAALLWMLRGLFSPGWAFLGASIAVIRIGLFSYWMASYWGGSAAAAGGALVAGAVFRLWKKPPARHAAVLGICLGSGLVMLANTRPLEGALFSAPLMLALLWKHKPWRHVWFRVRVPVTMLLVLGAAFDLYYNWRITGDSLQLPQMLQRQQYAIFPYSAFSTPRPQPAYRHATIHDFYVPYEGGFKSYPSSAWTLLTDWIHRERVLFWFFLGPILTLPVLLGAPAFASRKLVVLGVAFLLVSIAFAWLQWPINSHYYAPATCAIYAYLVQAMRQLRFARWKGGPVGLSLVRSVALICVAMAGIRAMARPLGIDVPEWPMMWYNTARQNHTRAGMQKMLEARPEKTLIIVRYSAEHDPGIEWVYNGADIDGQKVVWAREMPTGNRKLLDYFKDRNILLLEPDFNSERLLPYTLPETDTR